MEIKLTKKAALAAADVLNIWLEDAWEMTADRRAQVIALDQLLEQLGSDWDDYQSAEAEAAKVAQQDREAHLKSPEGLESWLRLIFNAGDQDEMSWKHLGNGFAALVHFDDWKLARDYERPWMGSLPHMESPLSTWWNRVADIYKADPEGALDQAHKLSQNQGGAFGHLTAYLEQYEGAAH